MGTVALLARGGKQSRDHCDPANFCASHFLPRPHASRAITFRLDRANVSVSLRMTGLRWNMLRMGIGLVLAFGVSTPGLVRKSVEPEIQSEEPTPSVSDRVPSSPSRAASGQAVAPAVSSPPATAQQPMTNSRSAAAGAAQRALPNAPVANTPLPEESSKTSTIMPPVN